MFTKKEKLFLKEIIKKHLEEYEKEKKAVVHNISFLSAEERYDIFLKELLKKLG